MKRLLSYLLWLANSDPPYCHRERFYAMKTRILRRYATREGTDLQEIPGKKCWGPYQSGCLGRRCRRCEGTGWYAFPFWVKLERWRLGSRLFHIPGSRQYQRPDGLVGIVGRIEHQHVDHWSAREAALWLALAFDRGLFWRMCATSCPCGWTGRPLCTLGQILFHVRGLVRRWIPRRCRCGRLYIREHSWQYCRRCAPDVAPDTEDLGEVPF